MLPALMSTMASTANSCSAATARRIASKTRVQIGLLAAFDFLHDDQLLAAVLFDGEDRAAIEPQARMALLDGQFDVLRIIIDAVKDDQVFHAAGDEQFAVLQEAQIAGAHEGAFAGVLQAGAEGALAWPRAAANSLAPCSGREPRFRRFVRRRRAGRCRDRR